MATHQVFEQSIFITASATIVERCFTDLTLMHRWLNPSLRCDPIGEWQTDVGGRSRFVVQIPLWQPELQSVVLKREPGLVVWGFTGFFRGRDRWECLPSDGGTELINRFEFEIPNPLVSWGFRQFAARWTKSDMEAQLRRIKRLAEALYVEEGTR